MRRPAGPLAVLAAALVLAPARARAETPAAAPPPAFAQLQALDGRVQSVGWRLVRGNARYCHDVAPAVGLLLQDLAGYADPGPIRAAVGGVGDIAVEAIAAGSPAERAQLAPNDPLEAVAGQPVASLPAARPGDYARLAGLHDRIDAALRAHGQVELVRYGKPLTLVGEPACVTRFEVLTSGSRAAADGRRVVVSRKFVEFLEDDEQLAALLAHELAHNVLGHRARLAAAGRSWANVRTTEREADRLSVWLLANAGYDPAAALRFMAHWGPPNDQGIFSTPDHDRWRRRYRLIADELARLAAARAAHPGGAADWPRHFLGEEARAAKVSG